eukprot:5450893-Prymnesium_polylepis.1
MTHPLGQRQGGRVRRRWRTGLPAWAHHGALFMTTDGHVSVPMTLCRLLRETSQAQRALFVATSSVRCSVHT